MIAVCRAKVGSGEVWLLGYLSDHDACLKLAAPVQDVGMISYCDVHEASSDHWKLWLVL